MGPKTKSKNAFESCDECEIILSAKDVPKHMDRYHGNGMTPTSKLYESGYVYGFIKGKIVHGIAKIVSAKDEVIQKLPPFKSDEIVVLSPSVMLRCGISIGDAVVVWKDSRMFSLQIAWPATNSNHVNVGLTPTAMALLRCRPDDILHVSRRELKLLEPAEELVLDTVSKKRDSYDSSEFQRFIVITLDGKKIIPGILLSINYFGKIFEFRVTEINGNSSHACGNSTNNKSQLSNSILNSELSADFSKLDLSRDDHSLDDFIPTRGLNTISNPDVVDLTPRGRALRRRNNNSSPSAGSPVCSTPKQKSSSKLCDCPSTNPLADCDVTYYVHSKTRVKFSSENSVVASTSLKKRREVTFADIGGLSRQVEEILQILNLPLTGGDLFGAYGLPPQRGIILFGPPGTGKSLLGCAIAHKMKNHFFIINGPELYSKFYGETEAKLRGIFREARQRAPSVLFIDEIDSLCPKRDSSSSQQEQRVVATLLTLMDELPVDPQERVVVVAATNKPDRVDPAMRRPGRLDREIEIGIPTARDREHILHCLLKGVAHDLGESEIASVAGNAHGYVGADLAAICSQAGIIALKRSRTGKESSSARAVINYSDIVLAAKDIKPSALRELHIEIPKVKWEDVGGQDELKRKLRQAVEWPLKHPDAFLRMGITPPRGVLMYGPPGCSKTLIAKALATESILNFIAIKGPELFNKWVGESERAIREVFRKARAASPSIVFFDEIDALAGERGSSSSSSQVGDRVLAQLLTEMDGLEQLHGVTVVASTNRPDMIDKALLRPGRLDRIVYVPLPDEATRREIFQIQFRKIPIDLDVSVEDLVSNTSRYSGAEVVAVCNEAALKAMEDNLETDVVKMVHFRHALLTVMPRISTKTIAFYEKYNANSQLKNV